MSDGNEGNAASRSGAVGTRDKRDTILNVREEIERQRSPAGHLIDAIGEWLASPHLFLGLLGLHLAWAVANLGLLPGVPVWDRPPFTLLATIASVEAPLLAILILMRQSQDRRVAELREETVLQVNLHVERETTRLLRILLRLQEGLGLESREDPDEMERLQRDLDPEELLHHLQQELPSEAESEGESD